MKWYFDPSVFVAAAVTTHPHHSVAIKVLKELVADGHQGMVSGHSTAEIYSALSRAPFPDRHSADQVLDVMQSLVFSRMELVTLTGDEYEAVVRRWSAYRWLGGKIYDAIHVACAVKWYTFN